MSSGVRRRRALCVRPRPNLQAAAFLAAIKGEWIEALSLHCDVEVVEDDFDFDQVCDAVQPDFVLFEMVSWPRPQPLDIANAGAHPNIPRAALLNGDPHEPMRPLFYQMLDRHRVQTIFGYGLHHHQHMPELAGVDCFSVSIFVDGAVFRDYGLDQIVPVSVFGGHMAPSFYPWRTQLVAEIQHVFPTLVYPHPGYRKDQGKAFAAAGVDYARLLNQSQFSAADTTRLDYVVRKHLEIPGAGSVLVAPASPALQDYGFIDMENCILGSPGEICDKIEAVSRDPALHDAIRQNGFDLVHSRYTRENWTYVTDWFECREACGAGQVARQRAPLGRFDAVAASSAGPAVGGVIRASPMSAVLRRARDAILTGRGLDEAHAALREVSTWSPNIGEPAFLLGIVALLRADPINAAMAIAKRAEDLRRIDLLLARLDPCELAWLLLIAHLIGHASLAEAMHAQAKVTRHLALRRVLWLLDETRPYGHHLEARMAGDQLSVHWLGQESFDAWCDCTERVLDANGASDRGALMRRRLRRERPVAEGSLLIA